MADKTRIITTILEDGTKTPALNIEYFFITNIQVPASMTGTAITFEGGNTADVTVPLRDFENSPITITIDDSAAVYSLEGKMTAGLSFIKVVSGAAEAADREIILYGYKN